jgi:hypothetical protein
MATSAQEHNPTAAQFLEAHDLHVPPGITCDSADDSRHFLECLYAASYDQITKGIKKDPKWQFTVIEIAYALLDGFHADPKSDSDYFLFVIRLSVDGPVMQSAPFKIDACSMADGVIGKMAGSWNHDNLLQRDLLEQRPYRTAFRSYQVSGCCTGNAGNLCKLVSKIAPDGTLDLPTQLELNHRDAAPGGAILISPPNLYSPPTSDALTNIAQKQSRFFIQTIPQGDTIHAP